MEEIDDMFFLELVKSSRTLYSRWTNCCSIDLCWSDNKN